jgi:polygalacturonase
MRHVPWILFTLVVLVAASASAETDGVLSVKTYGAVCNGSAEDTAHFQAAAKAAEASYASTSSPVTVVYSGDSDR